MSQHIRSLLFVPASQEDIALRSPSRGADVIILDMEDGVPREQKEQARNILSDLIQNLETQGAEIWVRPNPLEHNGQLDLEAITNELNPTILLPKISSPADIRAFASVWMDSNTARLEARFVPTIEDPSGVFAAVDIAAEPYVTGLAFGSEDFATSAGISAELNPLALPAQMVALAAAANACPAYGIPDSIANYHDLPRFQKATEQARKIGYSGALCIHPAQVKIANEVFRPTEDEIKWAQEVVRQASATGAVGSTIGMIDAPVLARAQNILDGNKN